jgi:hypothetical protein
MTTQTISQTPMEHGTPAADSVPIEVLSRLGENDPVSRKAYELWLEHHRNELAHEPLGSVVHRFTSPAMQELAVEFFLSDIEENAAIIRFRLAQQRRQEALTQLHAGLAKHDFFFTQEEDVVHENRLEVRRVSRVQQLEFRRKLVRFSRDLVEGALQVTPEQVATGELPDCLKRAPVSEYATELGEYIVNSGEPGRELVLRICDDAEFATQVEQDERNPRALRYLAELSNSVRDTSIYRAPAIGFAAA